MAACSRTFILKNDLSELESLQAEVEEFAERGCLPLKAAFEVNLALDELITNIISYGFPHGGEHKISVELALSEGVLHLRVSDDGIPFNPLCATAPDVAAPMEERQIGGLGIHLVKSVMDHVAYAREHGRNVISLRKHLPGCRPGSE